MPGPSACEPVPMQQGRRIAQLPVSIYAVHAALLLRHHLEPTPWRVPGTPVTTPFLSSAASRCLTGAVCGMARSCAAAKDVRGLV